MGDDRYGNQESLWKNTNSTWTRTGPKITPPQKKTKQFYYHSLLQMQKKNHKNAPQITDS